MVRAVRLEPRAAPALGGDNAVDAALPWLVRAVGSNDFGPALLHFLRQEVCAVDQLVGFTRKAGRRGVSLFTVGDMPPRLAQSLTQRYLDSYHLMDPTADELGILEQEDAWLTRMNREVPASSVYRAFFFTHSRLVDRVAILTRGLDGAVVACHGYRRSPSPEFADADLAALQPWLGTLAALLRQHHALAHWPPHHTAPEALTAAPPPSAARQQALARLSAREKAVFQRLLAGLSTDAMALDLGVSVNTVRTFRKKLYRKLEVTSRLELYQKYMHLGGYEGGAAEET
ncbi:MAG: LuxR C-terminal-related transcriptional regulator [Pigmentiphaga sp.]